MKLKLLMVIAAGIVATQSASAQWSVTGNAGTNPATNFVGTTDGAALRFRTNNVERMSILTNGRVGVGTTAPQSNFDIYVATAGVTMGVRSDSGNAALFFDKKHTSDYNTVSYRTAGVVQWQTGSIGNDNYVLKNMTLGSPALTCVKATNYVGIGTNTPTEKLEVAGNIRVAGTVTATSTITALGGNSTNWNTAYGWGNHAAAGYLTAETDPQVGANTLNYVPKWNGSALVSGLIFDSGTRIGIGTATPAFLLDITSSFPIVQVKSTGGLAAMIIDKTTTTDNGYLIHRTGGADRWTEGMIASDNFSIHNWTTGYDAITANLSNNYIGINNNAPAYQLDVQGNTAGPSYYNINSKVNYVGTSDIRGVYSYSAPADGWGYGVDATGGFFGGSFTNAGGAYSGSGYGVAGYAYGTAGSRYGVYGYASNSGGPAWAGYFAGNTYATNMVVNASVPATGYTLTVGGKVICTEVRVQLTPFPDYVFEKNYNLNSIEDVEAHVAQFHRLPGMPSACEVEDNGLAVGEMQGKIVEKVEEQTLYIIQLNNKIKELEKRIDGMQKNQK